jgi:hypothetical protein
MARISSNRPGRGVLDGREHVEGALRVGSRQDPTGLGLHGDGRHVVADRIVQLARQHVALTQLGLLDVADPGVGMEPDGRAEGGGEQEEAVSGHHLGHPGRIGDVRDGEPGHDEPQADHRLAPGTPAEQRVRQHERRGDAPQQARLAGGEAPRHVNRRQRPEGERDRGQRAGAPPQQGEGDHDRGGQRDRSPRQLGAQERLQHRPRHEHADEHPVGPGSITRLRGAGFVPQHAQGVAQHRASVEMRDGVRISRKHDLHIRPVGGAVRAGGRMYAPSRLVTVPACRPLAPCR